MEEVAKLRNVSYMPRMMCERHKQQGVTRGCAEFSCKKRPLMCEKCFEEDGHREHHQWVLDLETFLNQFTTRLQSVTGDNRTQLLKFLSTDDNVTLFKFLNDSHRHLQKVQDNIDAQKISIA